jgi:hypothetical protein
MNDWIVRLKSHCRSKPGQAAARSKSGMTSGCAASASRIAVRIAGLGPLLPTAFRSSSLACSWTAYTADTIASTAGAA